MVLLIVLGIGFLYLWLQSREIEVEEDFLKGDKQKLEKMLTQMSLFLYDCTLTIQNKKGKKSKRSRLFLREKEMEKKLRALSPGREKEYIKKKYFVEKMNLSLLVIFAAGILGLVLSIAKGGKGLITEGSIVRNGYGKSQQKTVVDMVDEDGNKNEVTLVISSKEYTKEQVDSLYEACVQELEQEVLLKNESLALVKTDLNFPKEIKGYPFRITWNSSNHRLITNQGIVKNEELTLKDGKNGEVVMLEATLKYLEYEYLYEFGCVVWPKERSEKENYEKALEEALKKADEETITTDKYYLPETVGGKKVQFREKEKDYVSLLAGLGLLAGMAMFFVKDDDLRKKIEERKEEMLNDYPDIVTKLTLLVGAGMTVRGAFKRMVEDYHSQLQIEKGNRYAYEEMILTLKEIEAGVSEMKAYEQYGKRCGLQQYVKLATLITQNMRKGTAGFEEALEKESKDALQERRNNARIKGEKAGTKLLAPMMMMLLVVLIMIMVPAFQSFG